VNTARVVNWRSNCEEEAVARIQMSRAAERGLGCGPGGKEDVPLVLSCEIKAVAYLLGAVHRGQPRCKHGAEITPNQTPNGQDAEAGGLRRIDC
jgi:hypothetical protein